MSMIVPIVGALVAAFVLTPAWGAVLLIGVVGWELGEKFFWIRLISRYPVRPVTADGGATAQTATDARPSLRACRRACCSAGSWEC